MYLHPTLYKPRIFTCFSVLPTKSATLFLEKGVFSGMNRRATLPEKYLFGKGKPVKIAR
jgi:hypothetical protein